MKNENTHSSSSDWLQRFELACFSSTAQSNDEEVAAQPAASSDLVRDEQVQGIEQSSSSSSSSQALEADDLLPDIHSMSAQILGNMMLLGDILQGLQARLNQHDIQLANVVDSIHQIRESQERQRVLFETFVGIKIRRDTATSNILEHMSESIDRIIERAEGRFQGIEELIQQSLAQSRAHGQQQQDGFASLHGRVGQVAQQVATVQGVVAAVQGQVGQVAQQVAEVQVGVSELQGHVGQVEQHLDEIEQMIPDEPAVPGDNQPENARAEFFMLTLDRNHMLIYRQTQSGFEMGVLKNNQGVTLNALDSRALLIHFFGSEAQTIQAIRANLSQAVRPSSDLLALFRREYCFEWVGQVCAVVAPSTLRIDQNHVAVFHDSATDLEVGVFKHSQQITLSSSEARALLVHHFGGDAGVIHAIRNQALPVNHLIATELGFFRREQSYRYTPEEQRTYHLTPR